MILEFGKHRGETCEDILKQDPGYVAWLLREYAKGTVSNEGFVAAAKEFQRLTGNPQPDKEREIAKKRLPWWEILEVGPKDSLDTIKSAYRKQMSLYHPDKVSQLGSELKRVAEDRSKEINWAYEQALKQLG